MNNHLYIQAITLLHPTAEFTIDGDTYAGITWLSPEIPKPTEAELDAMEPAIILSNARVVAALTVDKNKKVFSYAAIDYLGTKFTNSEIAGNNLQAAFDFSDEPVDWLDVNGDTYELSKLQIGEMIGLIMTRRKSGYFQEAAKLKAIAASQTLEELATVDLTFS